MSVRYVVVGVSYGSWFSLERMPDSFSVSAGDELAWVDRDVSFRSVL
jgi:hypothetical protein